MISSQPVQDGELLKNVLIVSYLFPPVGGIGVQRPLKFVRYLEQSGWHPTVLTAAGVYSATMDAELFNEVPEGVLVYRVNDVVSTWIGRFISKGPSLPQRGTDHLPPQSERHSFKQRVGRWLKTLKDRLMIPDESVFWALQAAWKGRSLIKKHHISCLYTTSGPNSTHVTGMLIRLFTGVKWVADFRDPWIDNMHYKRTGLLNELESRLESNVFHSANAIMTVTESFRNLFATKYPESRHKMFVIRNGVDPNDYAHIHSVPHTDEPFTIFYAGILYPERSPAAFFEAVRQLLNSEAIPASDIRIQFAGIFDYPGKSDHYQMLLRYQLADCVERLGYLPHQSVIAAMEHAHVLLLIGEGQLQFAMYIPGKLYEYLYAKRPILALMHEGEGASIIRSASAGIVVPPQNTDQIAAAILTLYQMFRSKNILIPDQSVIRKYSRIEQTKEFAELLNQLVES